MKHAYQAAILLMLGTGSAAAQEDWTGYHVGGALVASRAEMTADGNLRDLLDSQGIDDRLFAPSGSALGLRVGRDWQHGNLVLGLVAEYQAGHASAGADDARIGQILQNPDVSLSRNRRVVGRIGYAAGDWLPYALAGQDVARFRMTGTAEAEGDIEGNSLGLGVEHRVTPHLSTFAEYSQTDFDPIPGSGGQLDLSRKDLRLGASFRF